MAKEINGIDYQDLARMALQGLSLTRERCYAVLRSPEEMILSLLQATFKVRERYFGKKVIIHFLINAVSHCVPPFPVVPHILAAIQHMRIDHGWSWMN